MNIFKKVLIIVTSLMMSYSLSLSNIGHQNPLAYADTIDSQSTVLCDNTLTKTPWNWNQPNNTYLQSNSDGTINRIVYTNDALTVETYSNEFDLLSSNSIEMELPIWGAFYSGSEYNFCVFGQQNLEESNTQEVIRIVKYSKDWQRLDSVSMYGCNTQTPFDAGRPHLNESNGTLYLYTSHTMFKTYDGYNHQSNMSFYVNISDMSITFEQYDIGSVDWNGYISHSFDQYIVADNSNIFNVDLGDAYPRGVAIVKRNLDGSLVGNTLSLSASGNVGDNYTGIFLGGFELSESNCLILGNSIAQDGSSLGTHYRNIFLTVTSKDFTSNEVIWLTNFNDSAMVSIPKLVKIDNDTFIAMWNEVGNDGNDVAHVIKLNGEGKILQDVSYNDIVISDCDPIVIGDNIVWFYSSASNGQSRFYSVNHTDLNLSKTIVGDINHDGSVNALDLYTLKKHLLGISSNVNNQNDFDLNKDDQIDILDLILLKDCLLNGIQ